LKGKEERTSGRAIAVGSNGAVARFLKRARWTARVPVEGKEK